METPLEVFWFWAQTSKQQDRPATAAVFVVEAFMVYCSLDTLWEPSHSAVE